MSFLATEIIRKKKLGTENTAEEIQWFVNEFVLGAVTDYQMSAWAMAIWFRGMTPNEVATLTRAMLDSGEKFDFSHLNQPRIDKHSTGGVGDKTSLIIGPIMAAAKIHSPMIAGRGLAHTGGTLDKLESLKGFRVNLTTETFTKIVTNNYFALMGQTASICPADRKMYALRDVTSTVDSLPLICGSIMSKKLAEDLTGLVLDVKFGSGAFMKTVQEATDLAQLLKSTGEKNGVKVHALITNMNEPLGRFVGNALEVHECVEILSGKKFIQNEYDFYASTRDLSLELSGHMIYLAGKSGSVDEGILMAQELLASGAALNEFLAFLDRQGSASLKTLVYSKNIFEINAQSNGFVNSIDTEAIGRACIELGAGRKKVTDQIDHTTGLEICCRIGDPISVGQNLFKIYFNNESTLKNALEILNSAIKISDKFDNDKSPLIAKVLI